MQQLSVKKQAPELVWYCARTKPKHEHIAAANVHKNLGLKVFHPRLRGERATLRGVVRVIEPLFPCYIFVHCLPGEMLNEIRHTPGVSTLVHFGDRIPTVPDAVIEELQECFEGDDPMPVQDRLLPGAEVVFANGAFVGVRTIVLRVLPARQRVQVLLDILGRPTPVEVPRASVALEKNRVVDRVPLLGAPHRELLRV
jgi:transcriptional antiterminator RfaH